MKSGISYNGGLRHSNVEQINKSFETRHAIFFLP